jgi:predicted negative regulator of RcsB-dependent stress response
MAYDLEEQEQIESLKAFWKKYGNAIMTAITVVLLAFAGWRGWGWYQQKQSAEASLAWDSLRKAVAAQDIAKVRESAGSIFDRYSSTTYAQMAALLAARAYVDAGDIKAAKVPLQWAIDHAKDEEFRHVARARLAGLLIDESAFDQASQLLSAKVPERYQALYDDRRGDLFVAQDKPAQARSAYKQALDKLGPSSPLRGLVQLKLDALGPAEG